MVHVIYEDRAFNKLSYNSLRNQSFGSFKLNRYSFACRNKNVLERSIGVQWEGNGIRGQQIVEMVNLICSIVGRWMYS